MSDSNNEMMSTDGPAHITAGEAEEYSALIRKLRPASNVRHAAEQLLAADGRRVDPSPFFTALSAEIGGVSRERMVAAWALGRTPLERRERDAAIDMLRRMVARGKRMPAVANPMLQAGRIMAAMVVSLFCALFVVRVLVGANLIFSDMAKLLFALSVLATPVMIARRLSGHGDENTRGVAADSLGRIGAIEAIGDLAGALQDANPRVRIAASRSLHELLPMLTLEHYGLLGPKEIANLAKALTNRDNLLVFKVLEALEHVGTPKVIPDQEWYTRNAPTHALSEAAERTLVVLRERERQEQQARTLVRPSIAPANPDGTLLRPAKGNADTPEEQLLRPSDEVR